MLSLARRRELLNHLYQQFEETVMDLTNSLREGNITIDKWSAGMKSELKNLHIQAAIIGKGGDINLMTQSDWGWVGAKIRWQHVYLNTLSFDMWRNAAFPSNLSRRVQMYGEAARHTLEHFIGISEGWPDLPYEPGDGSTTCLSGCKCHWQVRRIKSSSSRLIGWLVSWRMTLAEHCDDCVERSQRWRSVFIRA